MGNQMLGMFKLGGDKNRWTFLRRLSNKMGRGKAVAIFYKLTCLSCCRMLISSAKNKNSERDS